MTCDRVLSGDAREVLDVARRILFEPFPNLSPDQATTARLHGAYLVVARSGLNRCERREVAARLDGLMREAHVRHCDLCRGSGNIRPYEGEPLAESRTSATRESSCGHAPVSRTPGGANTVPGARWR